MAAGEHAKVTFDRPSMTSAQMAESIGVIRATIMRRVPSRRAVDTLRQVITTPTVDSPPPANPPARPAVLAPTATRP